MSRPMNLLCIALILALACPAVSALAQPPQPGPGRVDLAQAEKILLDPRVDEGAFDQAGQALATRHEGAQALSKGAELYARTNNGDRAAACLRYLAVAARSRPNLIPDRLLPAYVHLLQTAKTPDPAVLDLMGDLGSRARPALPALRALRDRNDTNLGLRAAVVIRKIEGSK